MNFRRGGNIKFLKGFFKKKTKNDQRDEEPIEVLELVEREVKVLEFDDLEFDDAENSTNTNTKTVKELKREQKKALKEQKKRERLEKKAEKAHAKRVRKAALEELKKDKEKLYQLRKNRFLRVIRFFLWAMLIIIFVRGVVVSLKPDQSAEINKTIEDFKVELREYREQNNEIMAFAENFAYEYLTYTKNGESDYINRLSKYALKSVYDNELDFDNSAQVVYTQAYKQREYTKNQIDVYVLVDIEYTYRVATEEKDKIVEEKERKATILKVPVAVLNNRYVVENTPLFVNDDIKLNDYQKTEYRGVEISQEQSKQINEALANFFSAYYEGEQNVINYFLAPEAIKEDFVGLNGRMKFNKITSSRYYLLDDKSENILALLTVTIEDLNSVKLAQNFNLTIVKKDDQYYVKGINARNSNLNIEPQGGTNE